MLKNFYHVFEKYATEEPEKVLLTVDTKDLTYSDFLTNTKDIGKSLISLGIKKDDKVGLILSNSLVWYEVFWSAIFIGAQPVPIDPQNGELELERLLNYSDIKVCFIEEQYRTNKILETAQKIQDKLPAIQNYIFVGEKEVVLEKPFWAYQEFINQGRDQEYVRYEEVEEGHVMSLACTSGSTGNPKVLSVPYEGFYDAINDMGKYLHFGPEDTMMVGMPLYHQGGFGMGLQSILQGGSAIYQPTFDPIEFLKTVQERKITIIQLTATLAKILISNPEFNNYDLSSVKICYFASEVLPVEIAKLFVEKLHIRVINVIGSSETATMVVWDSDKDFMVSPSCFHELPFTRVHILDENQNPAEKGELCIYTSAIIYDYYKNEKASKEMILTIDNQRCLRTGDMVERMDDGRLHFLGRCKRIIKRGANLVHAEEVEEYLLTYPKIEAVAIVAEKHPVFGEQIVAYIQTVDKEKITRNEIARYFQGKVSSYKLPDKVIVTDKLQYDVGKIQFKFLRKPQ